MNSVTLKELVKKVRVCFSWRKKYRLRNQEFTIISSNCIAGTIYHELGKQFLSPTINMYMKTKDYLRFCYNLDKYCKCVMEEVDLGESFPTAKLNDIIIYGTHYKNFSELEKKWNSRVQRMRWDKLYFMMIERDGCTHEDLLKFDSLPYKQKVVFVHKPMPEIKSSFYIPNTELDGTNGHWVSALATYKNRITGKRYIDDFDYVQFLNNN